MPQPDPLSAAVPCEAVSSTLRHDVAWNIASLAVMAACGLLLHLFVGLFYNPAVLGIFNLVYSLYIVASQLAAFGVHFSVLTEVGRHAPQPSTAAAALASGLLATLLPGTLTTLAFVGARPLVAALMHSPAVAEGMAWAAPGLFLFALNKTLLAGLNGLSRMRVFAVLQALRPVLMIVTFGICGFLGVAGARLPLLFSVAELGLFAAGLVIARPFFSGYDQRLRPWVGRHLSFGARSFAGGLLIDLNTRIDVLFLGAFWNETVVGVYSFAAVLAEGLFQVLVALRNTMNPRLSRVLHPPDHEAYRHLVKRVRPRSVLGMAVLGVGTVAAFMLAVHVLPPARAFAAGWLPLTILVSGVVAVAGAMPFSGILLQAGHPGANTWVIVGAAASNVLVCLLLVPHAAASGAALATASSFVVQVLLLAVFTQRRVGWRF